MHYRQLRLFMAIRQQPSTAALVYHQLQYARLLTKILLRVMAISGRIAAQGQQLFTGVYVCLHAL
jgi:hypothetical protein